MLCFAGLAGFLFLLDDFFDFIQGVAGFFGELGVAGADFVEVFFFEFFKIEEGIVGAFDGADELVDLDVHGLGITVLGVLNEEHHEEGDDGGAGVDDELPGVAVTKDRAGDGPDQDDASGEAEGRGATGGTSGFFGEAGEPTFGFAGGVHFMGEERTALTCLLVWGCGGLVDRGAGEFGEFLVVFFFLFEGRGEEFHGRGVAEAFGKGAGGAVAGDFVMLDALGGANEASIADVGVGILADEVLAFFDEAFHGLAGVSAEAEAEIFADLFEPVDVAFGLFEVVLEALLQFGVGGGAGHLRQRLHQLFLGAVEVLQLVVEEVIQGVQFHDALRSCPGDGLDGWGV